MCGRVVWIWDAKMSKLLRKIVDDPEMDPAVQRVMHKRRYNVPPASHLPVIDGRPSAHGDGPRMTVARWGFPIPKRPNGVFNTRIETAAESPMWRGMLGRTHCLWPVHGFYEWSGKRRTPYFIHRADGQPMLLAGLIQARSPETAPLGSIVTCAPNALVAPLHDRMPVIIEPKDARSWLAAEAEELAVPAGDVLACHQVGPDVNDTRNDRPDLMEPVESQGLEAFS